MVLFCRVVVRTHWAIGTYALRSSPRSATET